MVIHPDLRIAVPGPETEPLHLPDDGREAEPADGPDPVGLGHQARKNAGDKGGLLLAYIEGGNIGRFHRGGGDGKVRLGKVLRCLEGGVPILKRMADNKIVPLGREIPVEAFQIGQLDALHKGVLDAVAFLRKIESFHRGRVPGGVADRARKRGRHPRLLMLRQRRPRRSQREYSRQNEQDQFFHDSLLSRASPRSEEITRSS